MAAIDDLLVRLGEISEAMKTLQESRGRLEGYRTTRQEYASLAEQEKASIDAQIEASKLKLQQLADAINSALPRA